MRQQVVLLALTTAICLISDSMLYIVLPVFWQEVGLENLWQVGVVLAINRLIRIPLSPIIALLYNRISRKSGITIALIASFIITVGYGVANSFLFWVILRSLWGVVWTLLRMGTFLSITEISSTDNRGYFFGLYNGLYRMGSLFGMLVGGILADILGLRNVALLFSLVILIALPFILRASKLQNQPMNPILSEKFSLKNLVALLRDFPTVMILLTSCVITFIYEGVFSSILSILIKINYPSGISIYTLLIGVATLSGILQSIRFALGPFISPKVGNIIDRSVKVRSYTLIITLVAALLLFITISFKINIFIWVIFVILIFFTSTILTIIIDTIASEVSIKSKVILTTLYTITVDIGAALGPLIAYFLGDIFIVFWLLKGLLIFLILIWLLTIFNRNKKILYR